MSELYALQNVIDAIPDADALLSLSRDALIVIDVHRTVLAWNRHAEELLGYGSAAAIGSNVDVLLKARYPVPPETIDRALDACGHWEGSACYTTANGTPIVMVSRWVAEPDASGERRILISNTDVQVWNQVLDTALVVREGQRHFDSLFGLHPDGVFSIGLNARLLSVNAALLEMTGYSHPEILTVPLSLLVVPDHLERIRPLFHQALQGLASRCEFSCVRKDGSVFEADMTLLPYVVHNSIVSVHGIVKDISGRKTDERQIRYMATHDALTGLPNRSLLNDRLQHAVLQSQRAGTRIAVLFMDLNRFKVINDSLGHDKGDVLLCTVAGRLRDAVREIDTVARLGGDEFVVLLENIQSVERVQALAGHLLKQVCQPVNLDGNMLSVSTSIGGAIYPEDGQDAMTLLKHADLAMYEAKAAGLGRFRLFSPEMNTKALARLLQENSLRQAVERSEFLPYYQPRLDLRRNEIVAVEVLARWDHPEKGMMLPAHFIPLAEEIGMIDAIGEWVLFKACRQVKLWQQDGMLPIRLSVNISSIQLRSESICATVERALDAAQLDPSCLELEITESSLMQNLDTTYETLLSIRKLGVSLSIDDFGTGYSSLNYLKRLPIDTLKIDKSFIHDVLDNSDDAAIVTATIAMAHSMKLRVVAEGVTSFDQMNFLESQHCDEIQGYLLCQPLPAAEAESFFRTCHLRGIYYSWVQ